MTDQTHVPQYQAARVRHALATDPRTAEMGVRVTIRGDRVVLAGTVASEARRAKLDAVLREVAPELQVLNDVGVVSVHEPDGREDLR